MGRVVRTWFVRNDIGLLPLAGKSLNMTPIESLWNKMKDGKTHGINYYKTRTRRTSYPGLVSFREKSGDMHSFDTRMPRRVNVL